jgi:hypothetical protein
MSWTTALKEYAKQTGKFVVPKKGTPEYEAVLKIQNKMKGIPDQEEVKVEKVKKERKKKEDDVVSQQQRALEEQKVAEEAKLLAEAKAIQDAKDAKALKRNAVKLAKIRLDEQRKQLEEEMKSKQEYHGKLEAQANTMKRLKVRKITDQEKAIAKEEQKQVIQNMEPPKLSKKKAAAKEPSFRIEDKKIIISFSE